MDLTNIPRPHVHDKGKVLTGEEKEKAAGEVTPLEKISHESKCSRVKENSVYPRHYERY